MPAAFYRVAPLVRSVRRVGEEGAAPVGVGLPHAGAEDRRPAPQKLADGGEAVVRQAVREDFHRPEGRAPVAERGVRIGMSVSCRSTIAPGAARASTRSASASAPSGSQSFALMLQSTVR